MISVLLIEDDEFKREDLAAELRAAVPGMSLSEAQSVKSALLALQNCRFDLIILDMSLPTFDVTTEEAGWRPQGFGGREFLRFMSAEGAQIRTIVVTQHSVLTDGRETSEVAEVEVQLKREFPSTILGFVRYTMNSDRWKKEFAASIRSALRDL